eukprot:scaffold196599_cov30-Tisochrysis_lutea.AAC.1
MKDRVTQVRRTGAPSRPVVSYKVNAPLLLATGPDVKEIGSRAPPPPKPSAPAVRARELARARVGQHGYRSPSGPSLPCCVCVLTYSRQYHGLHGADASRSRAPSHAESSINTPLHVLTSKLSVSLRQQRLSRLVDDT